MRNVNYCTCFNTGNRLLLCLTTVAVSCLCSELYGFTELQFVLLPVKCYKCTTEIHPFLCNSFTIYLKTYKRRPLPVPPVTLCFILFVHHYYDVSQLCYKYFPMLYHPTVHFWTCLPTCMPQCISVIHISTSPVASTSLSPCIHFSYSPRHQWPLLLFRI